MRETRRSVLSAIADGPIGGPALADRLDCSRAAIWKHVEGLRDAGFEIESGVEGYRLDGVPEYGGPAVEFGLDAPYEVEYHDRIASTNERARQLAGAGERGMVVLADAQTGGRGRLDREWNSPSGGIWCSLVVRPDLPLASAPVCTLAAAVAVVEAVAPVGVEAGIKWPNDVLVDEQKLAGILTETAGEQGRLEWVVIGIGLNANVATDQLPEGATSLQSLVGTVDRRTLLQRLLESLQQALAEPATVIDRWREHALTLGRRVKIETGTETVVGKAVDITHPGTLRIATPAGRRQITAGDCEHLRPVQD